jgi:hypothetical protein
VINYNKSGSRCGLKKSTVATTDHAGGFHLVRFNASNLTSI